ncbi:MAG: lysylphosphatidylglycerol synthase transmembrane domain-containing protein [Chloroflexota bacterium]
MHVLRVAARRPRIRDGILADRRAPSRPPPDRRATPPADPGAGPLSDASDITRHRGLPGGGRRWQAWAGAAVSAAFLFLAFRGQHPAEVLASLREVDLRWLPPALLLFAAGVAIRAWRWSVLIRPVAPLTPAEVMPALLAGYTANNILPFRTGEVVRAYLLGSRHGLRTSSVLGTIAVERLLDGLTMLGFLLAAMTVISPTPELRRLALLAAILFAVAIAALGMLVRGGAWRDRALELLLFPLPLALRGRIRSIAQAFLDGLGALTRGGDLLIVAVASAAAWACEAGMYWAIARGFGPPLSSAVDPAGAALITGVANLATLVPAAPGYVGTFEAGVVLAAAALGVSRGLALSYALLVHAALWFPVTVVGAFAWWRMTAARKRQPSAAT